MFLLMASQVPLGRLKAECKQITKQQLSPVSSPHHLVFRGLNETNSGKPVCRIGSAARLLQGSRVKLGDLSTTWTDLQFYHFLNYVTDLTRTQIMLVFDLLDWDGTGEVGFDEFYMLVCIIMSHENSLEKQFMYRHSHPVFELLDIDGGHTIGPAEFQATRFLFNIKKHELSHIFKDFDISGDEQLNYKEFRMFTIFCIDRQQKKAREKLKKKQKAVAATTSADDSDFLHI